MRFYYAAARSVAPSPVARALSRRAGARTANDNDGPAVGLEKDDRVIDAALRHFSRHGLTAAAKAADEAETAFFAGDRQRYDWWRSVCRTLDRRMAAELTGRVRTPTS